ncbi:MAG: metallophosphoesterase [Alphaproteobacteria bacterium]
MTYHGIGSNPQRIYAIGDIHGRLDLLERAIGAIRHDAAAHGSAALTVTIGDYIDRGPQSRGVLNRKPSWPILPPATTGSIVAGWKRCGPTASASAATGP